jgi:hypothetical protein
MNRRWFLGVCAAGGASTLLASEQEETTKISDDSYRTIEAVQQHMFPRDSLLPSAQNFHATQFLIETIMHPTYDKDIRKFVIEGARELQSREKQHFLAYGIEQKEKALREYEETDYGSGWLDRIMLLSLEGLLSDPLYGGNYAQFGWSILQTKGGNPRPTIRYIGS